MMEAQDTLDVHQAAAMLHADEETVLNLARCGELPGAKIGRSWVFLHSDILDFLRLRIQADTAQRRQAAVAPQHPAAVAMPRQPARRRTRLPALPDLPALSKPITTSSP